MFTKILRIFRFIFEVIQVGLPFNVHFSGGSTLAARIGHGLCGESSLGGLQSLT